MEILEFIQLTGSTRNDSYFAPWSDDLLTHIVERMLYLTHRLSELSEEMRVYYWEVLGDLLSKLPTYIKFTVTRALASKLSNSAPLEIQEQVTSRLRIV